MLLDTLLEEKLQTAYHVAPSKHDQTIKQTGLKARDGQIYVWGDKKYADWFAELHRDDGIPMTVWHVDVSGIPLSVDPESVDMSQWSSEFGYGEFGQGYIAKTKHIEPNRIFGRDQ